MLSPLEVGFYVVVCRWSCTIDSFTNLQLGDHPATDDEDSAV